jgi:hypothetical protein
MTTLGAEVGRAALAFAAVIAWAALAALLTA